MRPMRVGSAEATAMRPSHATIPLPVLRGHAPLSKSAAGEFLDLLTACVTVVPSEALIA